MECCRICINMEKDLRPISSSLIEKIRKVLPIVILEEDPLPKVICDQCETKVNDFSELYDDAVRGDIFLRQKYSTAKQSSIAIEQSMVYFYDSKKFLTAAYTQFVNPTEPPDLTKDFHYIHIDNNDVYSCKRCDSNYVSAAAAIKHISYHKTDIVKTDFDCDLTKESDDDVICLISDEETASEVLVNKPKKKRKRHKPLPSCITEKKMKTHSPNSNHTLSNTINEDKAEKNTRILVHFEAPS